MRRGTDLVAMLLFMSLQLNVKIISCSGKIEIQIDHVYNIYGTLMNGSCCEGVRSPHKNRDNFCTGSCRTYLTFCVGDVASKKDCKYGKIVTPVLGRRKSTLRFPITNDIGRQLIRDRVDQLTDSYREDVPESVFKNLLSFVIPNEPKYHSSVIEQKYYIKMEARHRSLSNTSVPGLLISKQRYVLGYTPHNEWVTEPYNRLGADVIFHVRSSCDRNYYQDKCQKHCEEHEDTNLNWRCLPDGSRECLPGWKGELCDEAICNQTCKSELGCIKPNICGCPFGYEGENCEKCIVDPTCIHAYCETGYQCLCLEGWGGRQCHIDLNICRHHKCTNGGVCIPNQDIDTGGYTCECPSGYGGNYCQQVVSPCYSTPCLNNGECAGSEDGNNYTCDCPEGVRGRNCELDDKECDRKPCQNSGKCLEVVDGYDCECTSGWKGKNCTVEVDECASNPCVNAHNCTDKINDFQCNCLPGWSGKHCEKNVNDCKGQCRNNATCVDKINDFVCQCRQGFTGTLCEIDIDDCERKPCLHDGICVDEKLSYKCVCKTGYHGHRCEEKINKCLTLSPCNNGGNCTHQLNDFHCHCPTEWTGKDCSIPLHLQTGDHCNATQCRHNGTCVVVNGQDTCICRNGYQGRYCEIDVDDCKNTKCFNGGICVDRVDDFECVCLPGFYGRNCENNLDECASLPCQNGGSCSDGNNSFSCACSPGYQGYDCSSEVDECADVICHNGAVCVDGINTYACDCRYAYYGEHCENGPDYCYERPCGHHGNCSDGGNGSFVCTCHPGYDGTKCETEINECEDQLCLNGGVCVDKINAFQCKCPLGFYGKRCEFNNTCISRPCQHDGICINQGDDYHCQCRPSYYGKNCDQVNNACFVPRYLNEAKNMSTLIPSGYCSEHGTCRPVQDGFTCDCQRGWTGEYCQLEVDWCLDNRCENQATCVNIDGGYKCMCLEGFEGIYCQTNTDDCVKVPCKNGGKCIDADNDFLCECRHGWKGKTCSSRISSCSIPNPCQHNGTCVDLGDSFQCNCQNQYIGATCNVYAGPCHANPCQNGGTCLSNSHKSYRCRCLPGYEGRLCERETAECARRPCLNGGKCVEGRNMYSCECAPGYMGADCQFDIDECASQPCPDSMLCVDLIGTYECKCPPGRTGRDCENIIATKPCIHGDDVHHHAESWRDRCNTCSCDQGNIRCTQMTCSPSNCFDQGNRSNCTCLKKHDADCITPPCRDWGECVNNLAIKGGLGLCMPDIGSVGLSSTCAKVVIAFQISLLPAGTYLESICEEFRYLTLSQIDVSVGVTLHCSRTKIPAGVNLLNVSVHTMHLSAPHIALQLAKKFNSMSASYFPLEGDTSYGMSHDVLFKLSRAVVNVTVERHTHTSQLSQSPDGQALMVPLASGTASLALALLLILLLYAYRRRRKPEQLAPETFFTKKKNELFERSSLEKNTNRERNISKGDLCCELLDPNMYIDRPTCKTLMPMILGSTRDENMAV